MIKNTKLITYKALMIDLDGTTIPSLPNAMPSQRIIQAIQKAKNKVHVCAVTGRPPYLARPVLSKLELIDPCIICGGAKIIEPRNGDTLWSKAIPKKRAKVICDLLYRMNISLLVLDDSEAEKRYNPQELYPDLYVITVGEIPLKRALEIEQILESFKDIAIHKVVGEIDGYVWLQITSIDATKQYGVFKVAGLLGIKTHEIIGVGDGYNDFPLLMACGLKVAMGNAVLELKEIADYIAPPVEEDGLAWVIEKFILGHV